MLENPPFLKSLQDMYTETEIHFYMAARPLVPDCELALWQTPWEGVCRGQMHWKGQHVSRLSSLTKQAHSQRGSPLSPTPTSSRMVIPTGWLEAALA